MSSPEYFKKYREANKEKIKEKRRIAYLARADEMRERRKRYYEENKEKVRIKRQQNKDKIREYMVSYRKEYLQKNKESIKLKKRIWYIKNKDRLKKKAMDRHYKNRESILKKKREYSKMESSKKKSSEWQRNQRANNPEFRKKRTKICVAYTKKRIKSDPCFRMLTSLRRRLRFVVANAGSKKVLNTMGLVGCSFEEFKSYLESKFEPWMNWDNYGNSNGKWVIDHKIPCSSFDLSKREDQLKCFHYSNLQPLEWYENIKKSDSLKIASISPA